MVHPIFVRPSGQFPVTTKFSNLHVINTYRSKWLNNISHVLVPDETVHMGTSKCHKMDEK